MFLVLMPRSTTAGSEDTASWESRELPKWLTKSAQHHFTPYITGQVPVLTSVPPWNTASPLDLGRDHFESNRGPAIFTNFCEGQQ